MKLLKKLLVKLIGMKSYKSIFFILSIVTGTYLYMTMILNKPQDSLVDILDLDPSIIIDLKYATNENFLGKTIYPNKIARLTPVVAKALVQAQAEFKTYGVAIKIWDAHRPLHVQQMMWDILPDERYVANPKSGGRHTRGTAVDLTLVDLKTGLELTMPTEFDNFSEKAHRDQKYTDANIKANMLLLDKIMHKYGFTGLATEWWHYDYQNWQNFPVIP
jgi:D-alanyl-D-alanine dipeptidase